MSAATTPIAGPARPATGRRLHPVPVRIMHWTNAVAMLVMIGSGWGIYNDSVIFSVLHFPPWAKLGSWAAQSLLWHFAGMWLLVLNGAAYLLYGVVTGRLRERLLPIRWADILQTVRDTLHLKVAHEDLTTYNAVQKVLYIVVILAGVNQVVTGMAIWKPVQFSGLVALLGGFQTARLIHFTGMAVIVGFLVVHVLLSLLVPQHALGHADRRAAAAAGSPPMKSLFRPARPSGGATLDNHRTLIRAMERRGLLRAGLSLGALTALTGCDVSSDGAVEKALRAISGFNDRVQALLFDPDRLAPTYPESAVLKPPRFNAYYDVDKVKPVDGDTWRLELAGLIDDRRPWTRQAIAALPEQEIIVRHVCVEGWDYIGQWSGVPMGSFLRRVGADLRAKYVAFKTADDYGSSIDMATALHPQTLLATKYARETIADPFGYPLRLRTSTKLGFKNPKWITAIEVTNTYRGGYWEDQGFNWFSGI